MVLCLRRDEAVVSQLAVRRQRPRVHLTVRCDDRANGNVNELETDLINLRREVDHWSVGIEGIDEAAENDGKYRQSRPSRYSA